MRQRTEGTTWTVELDSLADCVEFCESAGPNGHHDSRDNQSGFRGTRSWEEARSLALSGWPEGEELIKKYSQLLFDRVASMLEQPRYLYDVEGTDFDVNRVLSGEPEVWLQEYHENVPAPGKVIRLVYNGGASGGVPTSVITARGAVAAALVTLLEHAGHSVELEVRDESVSGKTLRMGVLVKRAGQPLNLGEVAFALAHPSFLRRLVFSLMEHSPTDFWPSFSSGYGRPDTTPKELQGDIYLDRMMFGETQWLDEKTATDWIVAELKRQGVELKGE